jgi:DNA-binding transcriptional LysR family regulator
MDHFMQLRHLKSFVAVAEELHFGRAAERLGIAQPPLTEQIKRFERDLGYPLFARTSRKTELTDAGRVLLGKANELLRAFDQAIELARGAGRGQTGRLRVGTPPSMMLTKLPTAIRGYRARYPGVEFTLKEMSTSAIAEGLRADNLDVGFLREYDPPRSLALEWVYQEPLVAVLPAKHALAASPRVTLGNLAHEPFVFFPRAVGEAFYDRLIQMCVKAGFSPRIVQEATQWQSIVTCVETGMGVSVAPACVQRFRWPGVEYRPLPGLKTSVTVCRREGTVSAAAGAFLRLSNEVLSKA